MLKFGMRAAAPAAIALALIQFAPPSFAGDRWVSYGWFHPVGCGIWYPYRSCGRDVDLDAALGTINAGSYYCNACNHTLAESIEPKAPSNNAVETFVKYEQRELDRLR